MTPQHAIDYKLRFGKYKGRTLGQVWAEDSWYITDFLMSIPWKQKPKWQRKTTQSHVCSLLAHMRHGNLIFNGRELVDVRDTAFTLRQSPLDRSAAATLEWMDEQRDGDTTGIPTGEGGADDCEGV